MKPMNKAPSLWSLHNLCGHVARGEEIARINGVNHALRPEGLFSIHSRFKLAWKVFTGKADALIWGGGQ